MNDVLHFSIRDVGTYISLPWILRTLLTFAFGYAVDKAVAKQSISVTNARKLAVFIGKQSTDEKYDHRNDHEMRRRNHRAEQISKQCFNVASIFSRLSCAQHPFYQPSSSLPRRTPNATMCWLWFSLSSPLACRAPRFAVWRSTQWI